MVLLKIPDYVVYANPGENLGGRPTVDYLITIDMGKELAMVERNEKGVRFNVISSHANNKRKCELVHHHYQISDPAQAARAWLMNFEAGAARGKQLPTSRPNISSISRVSSLTGFPLYSSVSVRMV